MPGPLAAPSLGGCLLGLAVGDALGLPYERLSPRRAPRLLGPPTRHRFLLGRGMVSDDTEHACLALQALAESAGEPGAFDRALASGLRRWVVSIPLGAGSATLRASLLLCLGAGPDRAGRASAGNGPLMRAPVLGAAVEDAARRAELVRRSSRITHRDERALDAAHVIAEVAAHACHAPEDIAAVATAAARLALVRKHVAAAHASARKGESPRDFCARHLATVHGVGGFAPDTLAAVLQAFLLAPDDFDTAVPAVIEAGGDADTTGALVGALIGARRGREAIPPRMAARLAEPWRTAAWMARLAEEARAALETGTPRPAPRQPAMGLAARNAVFAATVLAHVARRLGPPW